MVTTTEKSAHRLWGGPCLSCTIQKWQMAFGLFQSHDREGTKIAGGFHLRKA